jgi:hypothetical protein
MQAVCQETLTGRRKAMGWTSNDYQHEGWVAEIAPDGRLSGSSIGAGILFHGITGQYEPAGSSTPMRRSFLTTSL